MTDKEIIKALGQCESMATCSDCPYFEKIGCKKHLYQDAFHLIKRLQAEIEVLKTNTHSMAITLSNRAKVERAETYKEFAERVKEKMDINSSGYILITEMTLDNLVKELTEVKDDV